MKIQSHELFMMYKIVKGRGDGDDKAILLWVLRSYIVGTG